METEKAEAVMKARQDNSSSGGKQKSANDGQKEELYRKPADVGGICRKYEKNS